MVRHLMLVARLAAAAVAVAVPLGVVLERARPAAAEGAIRGVGRAADHSQNRAAGVHDPAAGDRGARRRWSALWLYSLYPILRNTYSGVRDASPDATEAALALGMSPRQVLRYVRLPLAAPSSWRASAPRR
jgi:osmoprotectant transport system permease protein